MLAHRRRFGGIPWHYSHLVWFALVYAAALLILVATVELVSPDFEVGQPILIVAILFATVVLTAMWSVFGPGGYLQRVLWAHGLAWVVGGGFGLGCLAIVFRTEGISVSEESGWLVVAWVILATPPVSMAAQLPFWFFRLFFNWQIVWGDSQPARSIGLRDAFAVTFLFALSFAAPQMALNLPGFDDGFDPSVEFREVKNDDGSFSYENVKLTDPEEIEQRRRNHAQQARSRVMMGFGGAAVYGFAASLISFPVIMFMFRSKTRAAGFGWSAIYTMALIVLSIGLLVPFREGMEVSSDTIGYTGFALISWVAAISKPLTVSRITGFQLTSQRRFDRESRATRKKESLSRNQAMKE